MEINDLLADEALLHKQYNAVFSAGRDYMTVARYIR